MCRRILTERHGYRIAVIMNEFGDTAVSPTKHLSFESDLIQAQDIEGSSFASMTNKFLKFSSLAKTINIATSVHDSFTEKSSQYLELANGCLCCSIKNTGVATIEKILRHEGVFDHILLETSGLADPGMSNCPCLPE
jgi:G3E family GTPase